MTSARPNPAPSLYERRLEKEEATSATVSGPSSTTGLRHAPSLQGAREAVENSTFATSVSSQLRLMQICSSALPVGAFAYSHGLEGLVAAERITDEPSAHRYLATYAPHALGNLELPRLLRMVRACRNGNMAEARLQSRLLFAARETAEFRAQEGHLATAFHRLLRATTTDGRVAEEAPVTFAELYADTVVCAGVDERSALAGFAFLWLEGQVTAMAKLLALGPVSSQRLLSKLLDLVPDILLHALSFDDDDIGAAAPGLALASARHETQHFRLFRS
ncbi:MAG: urease accessory UreF family protein [Polyangiaceae bacterium]